MTATKVVIDCSLPDKETVAAVGEAAIEALIRAALEGKISAEQRDEKISEVIAQVTDAGALPDREQRVALTEAEKTDRKAMEKAAVEDTRRRLRAERDQRLRASDWTQLADAVLPGTSTLAQWATYRQALRDWPATVTDPLNPPPWPTEPV